MTAICNNKNTLATGEKWIKDSLQGKREVECHPWRILVNTLDNWDAKGTRLNQLARQDGAT